MLSWSSTASQALEDALDSADGDHLRLCVRRQGVNLLSLGCETLDHVGEAESFAIDHVGAYGVLEARVPVFRNV